MFDLWISLSWHHKITFNIYINSHRKYKYIYIIYLYTYSMPISTNSIYKDLLRKLWRKKIALTSEKVRFVFIKKQEQTEIELNWWKLDLSSSKYRKVEREKMQANLRSYFVHYLTMKTFIASNDMCDVHLCLFFFLFSFLWRWW